MTYKIIAWKECKTCHGEGFVYENHRYGATTATEAVYCGCVEEQLPDDDREVEITPCSWAQFRAVHEGTIWVVCQNGECDPQPFKVTLGNLMDAGGYARCDKCDTVCVVCEPKY